MTKTYAGLTATQIENFLRDEHAVRELYYDEAIRVRAEFQKIHAPSIDARKDTGRGKTLCGIHGIRGRRINCANCLKKLG